MTFRPMLFLGDFGLVAGFGAVELGHGVMGLSLPGRSSRINLGGGEGGFGGIEKKALLVFKNSTVIEKISGVA